MKNKWTYVAIGVGLTVTAIVAERLIRRYFENDSSSPTNKPTKEEAVKPTEETVLDEGPVVLPDEKQRHPTAHLDAHVAFGMLIKLTDETTRFTHSTSSENMRKAIIKHDTLKDHYQVLKSRLKQGINVVHYENIDRSVIFVVTGNQVRVLYRYGKFKVVTITIGQPSTITIHQSSEQIISFVSDLNI